MVKTHVAMRAIQHLLQSLREKELIKTNAKLYAFNEELCAFNPKLQADNAKLALQKAHHVLASLRTKTAHECIAWITTRIITNSNSNISMLKFKDFEQLLRTYNLK